MFQLHSRICSFTVKIRYALEVINKKLSQYDFVLAEKWNYDSQHGILKARKYFGSSTYEHNPKLDLEKFANQDEFLEEIDAFDGQIKENKTQ